MAPPVHLQEHQKKPPFSSTHEIVFERKFDTAIRESTIEQFWARVNDDEKTSDDLFFLRHLKSLNQQDVETSPQVVAQLLLRIMADSSNDEMYGSSKSDKSQRSLYLAWRNLLLQHSASTDKNLLHFVPDVTKKLNRMGEEWQTPTVISNLFHVGAQFESMVKKMAFLNSPASFRLRDKGDWEKLLEASSFTVTSLDWTFRWSRNLCIIDTREDMWVLPRSYILLIFNKIHDMISTLLFSAYHSGVCYTKDFYQKTLNFCRCLCNLSIKYKNDFYYITGCLEGLVSAETLRIADSWDNLDLLDNIETALYDAIGFVYKDSPLCTILRQSTIPEMHELGCLSKIAGHPLVDIEGGANKLYKRTTEDLEWDPTIIEQSVCVAKRTFVKSYVFRHGCWPPCEIDPPKLRPDHLVFAKLHNWDPDDERLKAKFGKLNDSEWARLTLLPCLKFSRYENVIPHLKDKTISLCRSRVVQQYLKDNVKGNRDWKETRLLLYYLLKKAGDIDHLSYLEKYEESDDLTSVMDYLIIRLVPKEKEHKPLPRFFGAGSYQDRMRRLIQEKNAMKFLDLYSDEQALTLSELEISKKLYAFRTIQAAYKDHIVIRINFDASGWNNKFRHQTTSPLLKQTLDDIFGTSLFWKTHMAYEKSFFYIPDGDATYYWDGQLGGIEGLNQDSWDWVYVNQIRLALEKENLKYHILVKGDDLRVAVLIPPDMLQRRPKEEWAKLVMDSVSSTATDFCHEIKVQESYASEVYFTFSKICSVGTIELSQGMRKILRTHGANNAFLETLDDYVASTFSNAHSAARVMPCHYGCMWIGLCWSYWYLLNNRFYNNMSDDQLLAVLLVPNMLGGFPIIYLHNMHVRAESDLLSPFLQIHAWLVDRSPEVAKFTGAFMRARIPPCPVFERLFRDPYSLNITLPQFPKAVLQSYVLPCIKKLTKNEEVKELIKAAEGDCSKQFVKCLETMDPMEAKVASTLYSSLPIGVLEELLKKFETGKSIYNLLFSSSKGHGASERILRKVVRADEQVHLWRRVRMALGTSHLPHLTGGLLHPCPTEGAKLLREYTWGKEIHGITMPPMAHQITIMTPELGTVSQHSRRNHFTYNYTPPTSVIQQDVSSHWGTSGERPFLGNTTRTGNLTPTMSFEEKDTVVIRIKNLLDLLGWVNRSETEGDIDRSSNLPTLIQAIIRLYTDHSISDLNPFAGHKKSGTIYHHGRSRNFKESIVPNCLSNCYQCIVGHTDSHITLRSSKNIHYRINFMHVYCHVLDQMMLELQVAPHSTCPRSIWGVTTDCPYCSKPIRERVIMIDPFLIPCFTDAPLRYCQVDEVARDVIRTSYANFGDRVFHDVDEVGQISMELASMGLSAELVHQWKYTKKRIETRFQRPRLDHEGYQVLSALSLKTISRDIGTTELKCMEIDAMRDVIIDTVLDYCLEARYTFSNEEVTAGIRITPSSELPWYYFVERIYGTGRLPDLIRSFSRKTTRPTAGVYANTASATTWMGVQAMAWLTMDPRIPHIVFLTYMSEADISGEFKKSLDRVKWNILHTDVIDPLRKYNPSSHDPHSRQGIKFKLIQKFLTVCSIEIDRDSLVTVVQRCRANTDFVDVNLREVTIDWDEVNESIGAGAQEDRWTKVIEWGKRTWVKWPWMEVLQAFEDEEDSLDDIWEVVMTRLNALKFRVAVTTLDACVETVRKEGKVLPEDILEDLEIIPDLPTWNMPRVCGGSRFSRFIKVGRVGEPQEQEIPMVLDFSYTTLVPSGCYGHRLMGSMTSSLNKLCGVFADFQVDVPMANGSLISCLADGFGGFVECVGCLSQNSTILYNTKPGREGVDTFPEAARACVDVNGHKILNGAIQAGVWDLRYSFVLSYLEGEMELVNLVTCDAEIPWSEVSDAWRIWKNVIIYFSRVAVPTSMLVLKVNLGAADQVCKALHLVSLFCSHVFLHRSPASNPGGEMYIIAYGHHGRKLLYTMQDPDITAVGVTSLNLIIQEHYKTFTENESSYEGRVFLARACPRTWCSMLQRIPALGSGRMEIVCGVKVSLEAISALNQGNYGAFKEWIYKAFQASFRIYERDLNSNEHPLDIPGVETLIHKYHVAMRVLKLRGFMGWLDHAKVGTEWAGISVSKAHIYQSFLVCLGLLPKRLGFPTTDYDYKNQEAHMEGHPSLHPYRAYLDGMRTCQGVLSYYLSVTVHKAPFSSRKQEGKTP